MVGMGNIQVDGVPLRQKEGGAGDTQREVLRQQKLADRGIVGWRRETRKIQKNG